LPQNGQSGVRHRSSAMAGHGRLHVFLKTATSSEGSERVELVVRDRVTGARLFALPQARDLDYTMTYRDGRLVFSRPIPATVIAGFRLVRARLDLDGHAVFGGARVRL